MIRLTLALLLLFGTARAQETPTFVKDSLDVYVSRALRDWQIPGVAVAVIKDGKTVFAKGYGVREMNGADKVDENTLFMIGSNTKAFTATALALLEQEKKLTLHDKVIKWLPDFKMYDPWVTKEVDIADLLCHRIGFETFQGDFMFFDSDLTTAEVRQKWGKLKPQYGFRERWGYTNAAFMTAGEIIPKVTGKTWAEFLKERIFTPLGMNATLALSSQISNAPNKATAHTVYRGELRKIPYGRIDNLAPAGSISSSVTDLSKWVIMQLNNGKLDDKQVIPAEAINVTRTPHSILGNGGSQFNRAHFSLYGLGWFMEEYAGRKIVAHTGGVNGFVTSVCLVPEEKLGIIVLTNTDANNFYESLRLEIMDAYLGLPYRNYSALSLEGSRSFEKRTAEWEKKKRDTVSLKAPTSLPLTSYAGDYAHDVYGDMNIKMENGQLIMRFSHHAGRFASLEPLGGNRFLASFNDPLYGVRVYPFTVVNGKVKSVTVTVNDFVEFTPYEFYKK